MKAVTLGRQDSPTTLHKNEKEDMQQLSREKEEKIQEKRH